MCIGIIKTLLLELKKNICKFWVWKQSLKKCIQGTLAPEIFKAMLNGYITNRVRGKDQFGQHFSHKDLNLAELDFEGFDKNT